MQAESEPIWRRLIDGEPCHDDHSSDEVYETDAGTFRVTRHRFIISSLDLAGLILADLCKMDGEAEI